MTTPLQKALRNHQVLNWWADTQPGFRLAARALYCQAIGCPDCELGTEEEWVQDADVLTWLARAYPHTIAAHEEDSL